MTATSHLPCPIPLFAQLVHRLRHANARYDFIAYQCRHTQRRTHHAPRRARHLGLTIDIEKADAAFQRCVGPEACVIVVSAVRSVWESPSPVRDQAENEADADEVEDEGEGEDAVTPDMRTERARVCTSPALSPLDLVLRTVDDDDHRLEVEVYSTDLDGALPPLGAPRWRTLPLPDADATPQDTQATLEVTRTYDAIQRGLGRGVVRPLRASLPRMPGNGLPRYPIEHGIALPMRSLKRKLDDDTNGMHSMYARGREVGRNVLQVLG